MTFISAYGSMTFISCIGHDFYLSKVMYFYLSKVIVLLSQQGHDFYLSYCLRKSVRKVITFIYHVTCLTKRGK